MQQNGCQNIGTKKHQQIIEWEKTFRPTDLLNIQEAKRSTCKVSMLPLLRLAIPIAHAANLAGWFRLI